MDSEEEAEWDGTEDPQFTRVDDEVVDEEVYSGSSSEEEEFKGIPTWSSSPADNDNDDEEEEEEEEEEEDEDEEEDEEENGGSGFEGDDGDEEGYYQHVEAMALSKEERKICKKFAGHITNAAISNGWEEHETARMIYLFVGSLGMRIEKTVTFLNDLKIGSPLLLSGLCQAGTDFTPGQIILMMKVEADTDGE